jgi:S-adenosylmethionine-diacylglycerol 3-amino-3-carboxypropyl transferase
MRSYFADFNYSLANEDTRIEQALAQKFTSALVICGSGARAIPLVHDRLEKLVVVDVSEPQLQFFQLKQTLIQKLEIEDYLRFLGYSKAPANWRKKTAAQLHLVGAEKALAEWELGTQRGLIYCGRWESRLIQISQRIRRLLGVDFTPLFEASTLDDQRAVFRQLWPEKRLRILLFFLASRRILNQHIYRGHLPTDSEGSLPQFLMQNFTDFFLHRPAKESFFHQMLFLGEVRYAEGLPIEALPSYLQKWKTYQGRVELFHGNILQALEKHDAQFLSLSDIVTYMNVDELEALEQHLSRKMDSTCHQALIRTFLKHPELDPSNCQKTALDPAQDLTGLYQMQLFTRTTK